MKSNNSIWEEFPKLRNIPPEKFPQHILIIPDGNGRWAKEHGKQVFEGHYQGYKVANTLTHDLQQLPIRAISYWGFSADNWKRPRLETEALMKLFAKVINEHLNEIKKVNGRFFHIGRRDRIPASLKKLIENAIEETKNNPGQIVNLAIDFGGEDQQQRVVEKALKLPEDTEIDEDMLWKLRDGEGLIRHADLIIRTSGEKRISDVGWFNGAPTEFYFLNKYFPDVTTADIVEAIIDFTKRERRMGARPA